MTATRVRAHGAVDDANVPICVCVDHFKNCLGLEKDYASNVNKKIKNENGGEREADRHLHGPYVNVKNNNNESNKKQIWRSLSLSLSLAGGGGGFVRARVRVSTCGCGRFK